MIWWGNIHMSIPITRTKIRVPQRRAFLLSRPRLNTISADLLDYPFTLISAPAGYGKTSLMIELAHQASHPVCWYSIDPLDKEPKRFLAHLIHAIIMEFPEFRKSSLDLLENLTNPLNTPDQFISTLINDIYSSISENFAIFLDDFHLIDDQPQINGFISKFGQQMDENTHLLISSRKLFNFPDLPLLIGRKQVKGVDQEDLAFQPNELQEYFQEKLDQQISEEVSEEMIANTAGWITGLLLCKDKGKNLLPGQYKATKVTGANLDSYFAEQVLLKQPVPIRTLMLQTSLFDVFNPTFCKEVLGEPENVSWADFIKALTDHNLFIEQVEDTDVWIRYHHLFRDYLRRELEKNHPEDKREMLCHLLEIYLESQDWEKAFDVAWQLEDPLTMAEVIELAFGSLFHAGRIKLLSDWLEVLPEEGFSALPVLYSLKGFIITELGNPTLGLSEINNALNNYQINTNRQLFSKSLVWRSTANRIIGNYEDGITDSTKAIEIISNEIGFHLIKAEAYREIGLGFARVGNNSKALEFLKESFLYYKSENRTNNLAQVQMDIGHVLLNMGIFQEAKDYFLDSIPHWSLKGNNIQLSLLFNNLGFLAILTGDYIGADDWINKGEKHAILASSRRTQAFIAASRGDLAQSIKLFNEGLFFYNQAEILAEEIKDSFLFVYIQIAKSTCLRYLDDFVQSEDILNNLQDLICKGVSKYELGLWHLEWGYIQLAQNARLAARENFQSAQDIFAEVSRPYDLSKSLLGLCLTFNAQIVSSELTDYLVSLSKILTELESIQPLLPEFSYHREGITQLIQNYPSQESLEYCITEIDLYLEGLPEIQARVQPRVVTKTEHPILEIRGLGKISVHRAGKKITASEWIHQKTVREIFFYLLSHPRGVSKEQVGLTFWPESSPSQLSCQFKNAMYRLRRAVGAENILYNQETHSYMFNWDCQYNYDVRDFQESLKLAFNQPKSESRIDYLRQAISLYKHPFAPQLDGIWAEPVRRKLFLDYEKAQLEIAAFDFNRKNFSACRDACLAILEIDPCQEKAYQLCMKAYSELNNITEIHRLFNCCESNICKILGIRPSNATINLYKELTLK